MSEKIVPVCGKCGATGVKIYRDYGMFRRPENDRCNDCLEDPSWFVPCILDESDGSCWGYTSVPEEDCKKFYALPEKSATKPYWVEKGSHWSNSKVY